jgi:hypothetical protein
MKFKIKKSNFLPHQREWWETPNFIILLVGGFGCGKTYIACLKALELSYIHSGLYGQLVSYSYDMMNKTIVQTFKEIADRSGLNMTYNQSRKLFRIENWDGNIYVGSGDNPDSLRGPNLAWAGIDEPFIQKREVFDLIQSRIRAGKPAKRKLFMTGTPEQLNWGYDIAQNDGGKLDIGVVYGKTIDNVHVGKEYYENLYRAYSEEQRQAYLEGKFVNLTLGRAYKEFDRDRHIVHMDGIDNLPLCAGVDFNVDYMSAEIFVNGNGWVHFIDEIRLRNSNSFELAERLAAKYPGIRVYPDATGAARKTSSNKSDHAIFRDAGFEVVAQKNNPRVMDRVNAMNKMLREDHLTIEPGKCPMLVKDFERVVFKSGDLDKTSDESLTHASDGAGYGAAYLYPVRKREVYIAA